MDATDDARRAAAAEVLRALRRVRRGATGTQRSIYDAVLDRDPAPSLASVAAARGVSPQAVSRPARWLRARIDDVAGESLDADSHTGPLLGRIREALAAVGARPGDAVTVVAADGTVRLEPPVPAVSADTARLGLRARRSPPARACKYEHCDRQFTPRNDAGRYCSKACRVAAGSAARRRRYQARKEGRKLYSPPQRRCEGCGKNFEPTTSQNTCSPQCRAKHRRESRRRGPLRRCAACAAYYREREGRQGCCSEECQEAAAAGMSWELLGRGCLLAVLVLLADESSAGGHATSESIASRLGVSRSNALKHLGALQRAGLAVRFTPVSDRRGGVPHEFKSTVPAVGVAKVAPGASPATVEALAESRATPPQLGTDLWVLATLERLLPAGSGVVRRADVAAAIGRHTSSVSRSMDRLEAAGLLAHQAVPAIPATGNGTGGGVAVRLTLTATDRSRAEPSRLRLTPTGL